MKKKVKVHFSWISIFLVTVFGLVLQLSCNKETTQYQQLPDVSGIYHCATDVLTDSARASYIFVFKEWNGKPEQALVILWMRKQGDTAATYHLEGDLVCTRWERDGEGKLQMEAHCDLGSPAGTLNLSGTFIPGILFDYSAFNALFSDSGFVLRASGKETPQPLYKSNRSSYLGNWNFHFGTGSLHNCEDYTYSECIEEGFPEQIHSFTATVTIDDEDFSQNVNTNSGSFISPNPFDTTEIYHYWGDVYSLIILQPYGYTDIEFCEGLFSCNNWVQAWLPGASFSTPYFLNTPFICCDYCGNLNLVPSRKDL